MTVNGDTSFSVIIINELSILSICSTKNSKNWYLLKWGRVLKIKTLDVHLSSNSQTLQMGSGKSFEDFKEFHCLQIGRI